MDEPLEMLRERVRMHVMPQDRETYEHYVKRLEVIAQGLISGAYEQYWDEDSRRWKFREVD